MDSVVAVELPGMLNTILQRVIGPLAVVGGAAIIYSFGDPSVGFNSETALLLSALAVSIVVLTYVAEGGEALVASRRYGVPAGVRIFPFALLIAVLFTLVDRVANFEAPIMFGVIAMATILSGKNRLEGREGATPVLFASLGLLAVSVAAWVLIEPLRDWTDNDAWWGSLPAAIAALIFIGGIEDLLFVMVPLEFTDGSKLYRWYRPWWALIIGVSGVLFCYAILNPEAQAMDAILQGRVIFICILVGAFAACAFLFWLYFRIRDFAEHAAAPA
jgi:hypothetical protein